MHPVGMSGRSAQKRSRLALLVGLGLTFTALFPPSARHDAIVSLRKFYPSAELALLAGLTPAADRASVFFAPPGYSVVRFA